MLGGPTRRTLGHDLCHILMLQERLRQVRVVLEWAQVARVWEDQVWEDRVWEDREQDSQVDMAQADIAPEDIRPMIRTAISQLHHGTQATGLGSMDTMAMLQCSRQCPINSSSTLQRSSRERSELIRKERRFSKPKRTSTATRLCDHSPKRVVL